MARPNSAAKSSDPRSSNAAMFGQCLRFLVVTVGDSRHAHRTGFVHDVPHQDSRIASVGLDDFIDVGPHLLPIFRQHKRRAGIGYPGARVEIRVAFAKTTVEQDQHGGQPVLVAPLEQILEVGHVSLRVFLIDDRVHPHAHRVQLQFPCVRELSVHGLRVVLVPLCE